MTDAPTSMWLVLHQAWERGAPEPICLFSERDLAESYIGKDNAVPATASYVPFTLREIPILA